MKEVVKGLVIAVCIASSIKGRETLQRREERNEPLEPIRCNQSGATAVMGSLTN